VLGEKGREKWVSDSEYFLLNKNDLYLSVPEDLSGNPSWGVGNGEDDCTVDGAEQERQGRVAGVPQDQERDQGGLEKRNFTWKSVYFTIWTFYKFDKISENWSFY